MKTQSKPIEIRRRGSDDFDAFAGKRRVGAIMAWISSVGQLPQVHQVVVIPAYQRRGVGTKLYEALAKHVCEKYNKPLASYGTRTVYSEGFWQKQLAKGRATCIRTRDDRCVAMQLSCPAPASLGRARRRMK